MSVNTYLKEVANSLCLSDREYDGIRRSLETIEERITGYFDSVVTTKRYGSYVRKTILPRRADEYSDIDLMIVFNDNKLKPQTFLNKMKQFANKYYCRSEIYQDSPTIVLELNHIKFELTPALNHQIRNSYYIPNGNEWMKTDPDDFYDKLKKCNKNNRNIIKPIVRILKHWNIQKNDRKIPSFELEKRIAEIPYPSELSSYLDYLEHSLKYLKYPLSEICFSPNPCVKKALKYIEKARDLEDDGYFDDAVQCIKHIFPEV